MKKNNKKNTENNGMNVDELKDMCVSAFLAVTGLVLTWVAMWIFC